MGHSIQEYQGRYVILNDFGIAAFVAVLHNVAREHSDNKLAAILEGWDNALWAAGPGTIDLKFDDLIQSAEDRDYVLSVLDTMRACTARFGETIPASILDRTAELARIQLNRPFPAHVVLRVADALEDAFRADGPVEVQVRPLGMS